MTTPKKYELVKTDTKQIGARTLYRVKYLKSFALIAKGELGGKKAAQRELVYQLCCFVMPILGVVTFLASTFSKLPTNMFLGVISFLLSCIIILQIQQAMAAIPKARRQS
jgi:hypothetical protein